MSNLKRDILLIAVGAFLSTAVQAIGNLANALEYPGLFFPKDVSLTSYEWTQAIVVFGFTVAAIGFVRILGEDQL